MTTNDYSAAKLGQELKDSDDQQGIRDSPSYWWVPFIDDKQTLRAMTILKESFDRQEMADKLGTEIEEAPARIEETALFRKMFRTEAGISINRAMRESDNHRISGMIGLDRQEQPEGIGTLIDQIGPGWIGYCWGQMDSGKTHFAVKVAELLNFRYPEIQITSNIKTLSNPDGDADIRAVERNEDLKDLVRQSGQQVFHIYDEASSTGSGYAADAHKIMSNFRTLLQSLRKNECSMLAIGHTGRDVHPHILRQCNSNIYKPDQETARIYEDVDDQGEGEDLRYTINEIGDLRSFDYDTKEMSNWYWES